MNYSFSLHSVSLQMRHMRIIILNIHMKLSPKQVIEELYGPPPSESQKTLEDFKRKNIPKPEKPKTSEYSELFEILDIEAQYNQRFDSLRSAGVIEKLKSGEYGIIGINGQEYPIPTIDQVKDQIIEKEAILKPKIEQGFTQIILTPFAMPITDLAEKYSQTIFKHHQNGTLKATNGDTLELDENRPLLVWDKYQNADSDGSLIYFPKQLDQENHQGRTKEELLQNEISQGWQILLVEDMPDLPAEGQGKEISGRQQIEAYKTPREYLNLLQTDPQYQNEQGLTPEDWLIYAITYLEETNQVIDDWEGQGKVNWNIAGYFPALNDVSRGRWYRGDPQARLDGHDADNRNSNRGFRPGVSVS